MAAHNVIRILGSLPGGEVWSVNPKFGGTPVEGYEDLLLWAENIEAQIETGAIGAPLRNAMSSAAAITGVRVEHIGANGRLAQAAEVTLATPLVGAGSATKPFQTAMVFSLRTGRPGRSSRGRLYWPALGTTISTTTLRLELAVREAYLDAAVDFLTALQTAAPAGATVALAVVSQTTGVNTAVDQIQVGDILDTQRRRRDSAVEQYSVLPFPG